MSARGLWGTSAGEAGEAYPVLEQTCHEPAAELLAEADHTVLGAGVDLKVKALGGSEVVDEELAFHLGVGLELVAELGVLDEGVGGGDMVITDLLDDVLGLIEQLLLGVKVTCRGDYGTQLLVDL